MTTLKLGHAHIKVRDLERAKAFYETFLHLRVTEQLGHYYAFMSGGDPHHELALQNVGEDAPLPADHGTGLYHIAFEASSKKEFAESYKVLKSGGISPALVDHRISWAMYFSDPDGNGLEIYCDTRSDSGGSRLWDGKDRRLLEAEVLRNL